MSWLGLDPSGVAFTYVSSQQLYNRTIYVSMGTAIVTSGKFWRQIERVLQTWALDFNCFGILTAFHISP